MAKPYEGKADETCPHHLGELCAKVCPTCKFHQPFDIPGRDGITWECSLLMQQTLLIEHTAMTKRVGAEIEKFRNETVEQNRALMSGTVKVAQVALTAAEIRAIRNGAADVLELLPAPEIAG